MSNKLGFGGGPMFDPFWLAIVVLTVFCLSFALHSNMHELYFVFINCALIPLLDSALLFAAQVRIHSFWSFTIYIPILIYAWLMWVSIDFLIRLPRQFHFISRDSTLGALRGATVFTVPSR